MEVLRIFAPFHKDLPCMV